MHNLSNDKRRATRDLDLDFIKYSLDDNSIINFINELNKSIKYINFEIIDEIIPLYHTFYLSQLVKGIVNVNFTFNSRIYTRKCWMNLGCFKLLIKLVEILTIMYRNDR